jgi:hypothetical protein
MGLLFNFFAIGIIYGLTQMIIHPFFDFYLNLDVYQSNSAQVLVYLPWWCCKSFFGFLTDSLPIKGYRRKPYILLGWLFCLVFLLIIIFLPSENPYPAIAGSNVSNMYVSFLILMSLGYVLVNVTCEGIMVEWIHQNQRHHNVIQFSMYFVRYLGQFVSTFFLAFLCNSKEYGGTFGWGASLNSMMILPTLTTFLAIKMTLKDLKEQQQVFETQTFREHCMEIWSFMQQNIVWQMVLYIFVSRVCFSFGAKGTHAMYTYWLEVNLLTDTLFSSFTALIYAIMGLLLYQYNHLPMIQNWKKLVGMSTIGSVILSLFMNFFMVFDVFRSSVVALIIDQGIAFFEAMNFYVVLMLSASLSINKYESTIYGTLTSVANIAVPFAMSISNRIGVHFDLYETALEVDDTKVRWQVMYTFFIMYFIRLFNLVLLFFLPSNASEVKKSMHKKGKDPKKSFIVFLLMVFMFLWALLTSFFSVSQSTACLAIAGGDGC